MLKTGSPPLSLNFCAGEQNQRKPKYGTLVQKAAQGGARALGRMCGGSRETGRGQGKFKACLPAQDAVPPSEELLNKYWPNE